VLICSLGEELLSVHELYNLLNAGISKIHIL
jgi:hypothetical protein